MVKYRPMSRVFAACISVAALCVASLPLAAQPETATQTIAVLYFQDLGPSPEAKPLRKALAQMLITDLSRLEGLQVVQRERIEKFVAETGIGESGLATVETAVLAGRALEADYVVQGTFSATSKQITVDVKVGSREATAAELSRTFSRPVEEFMQLEQEIIEAIVEAVGVEPVLRAAPVNWIPCRLRSAICSAPLYHRSPTWLWWNGSASRMLSRSWVWLLPALWTRRPQRSWANCWEPSACWSAASWRWAASCVSTPT